MKKLLFAFLSIFSLVAFGQKKIVTRALSDSIQYATIDRPGDLYVITQSGQIQKFNEDGKLQILFRYKEAPTLFDPRDGARLFAYYRSSQHYELLNPSFEVMSAVKIDPSFAIQPWLMCPSGETKLWILDASDHSLKKINPAVSAVELEVVIDAEIFNDATQFIFMQEYQGFLFLLNPLKGIFIFNSLGRHLRTIETSGITTIHFIGEELYYKDKDVIRFFDLFTAETRELPRAEAFLDAVLTDRRMFVIKPTSMDFLQFTP